MKNPKRPRDPNQLARAVVALATGEITEALTDDGKNLHAVALGRLGGLKGGKARAAKLSKAKLVKIAKLGAQKRWSKKR
jgi:hypothetical protein